MGTVEVQPLSERSVSVSAFVPESLQRRLVERARENDRSASAELRVLLRRALDQGGRGLPT